MAVGIEHALVGKDAVGRDEVFEKSRIDGTAGGRAACARAGRCSIPAATTIATAAAAMTHAGRIMLEALVVTAARQRTLVCRLLPTAGGLQATQRPGWSCRPTGRLISGVSSIGISDVQLPPP